MWFRRFGAEAWRVLDGLLGFGAPGLGLLGLSFKEVCLTGGPEILWGSC